jgi:hypothetical protein
MSSIQWKINITIKDYFPKLKKIPYNEYNCIITYTKIKQIIPFKNKSSEKFQFSMKPQKKDLTYLVTLINTENSMVIGESNLNIASFRLKQLKDMKKIKYEQQIKLELNKSMKENLFGPGINIGNIYIKFLIEISISKNGNSFLKYKLENKNICDNNINSNKIGNDNNLNSLSLSSFLTNLSTLKENRKQNEKKIKNTSSFNNNIKYLCTEISHNKKKINLYHKETKEENQSKRKLKIFSPTKFINLKKNKSKWHINRDYLKSLNKNISTSLQEKRLKNIKLRKAFSNEDIRYSNNNIQLMTEICNNSNSNNSNNNITYSTKRKKQYNKILKTERTNSKNSNKFKKIIKSTKISYNIQKIKNNNKSKNIFENKKNLNTIIKDIKIKNQQIKKNLEKNNSKYPLIKEKIIYEHKVMNELQNKIEENNIKNYIHVNINKQTNNLFLNKMAKIKLNELNIFKIIFKQKIIANKNNNIAPKDIAKEKLKQQQQIQLLIKLIRNLVKIYGNLSHLFEKEQNKQILIKSLFLRYNIKETEWDNENDLFDIYEKQLIEKKDVYFNNRYKKEKEEFNTIKEEDEEELNTIE